MPATRGSGWADEAEVIVVGYGGAGAVAAVAARDAGADVLILEKQSPDTATKTRHTPSTRISGGMWFCPPDPEKALSYMESMARIANESVDAERKEMLAGFAQRMSTNTEWLQQIGVEVGEHRLQPVYTHDVHRDGAVADFPDLLGAEGAAVAFPKQQGIYRHGAAFFKGLTDAVQRRNTRVMWETPAVDLVLRGNEVAGVVTQVNGKKLAIRAKRGVILCSGGFEFNQPMKENYLRVNPVHFYGNPGNEGEGINMAIKVGAALWHMNAASWRVTMRFPDFPQAFSTRFHARSSIFVDRRGRRFCNERFRLHAFGYELTNYDCDAMCYPRVPCYWVFDEKRRRLASLASLHGACNPPGGVGGDIFYHWSEDNQVEIDRGWIMKADTLEELARKIAADPYNGGLMTSSALRQTVKQYNGYCRNGNDPEFGKPRDWLEALENPPFYAVALWPGGPNTQGGPKRDAAGRVIRVDGSKVGRLYAAGELGSVWGMLYQGGGNIAECVAFGRAAGQFAADEKPLK